MEELMASELNLRAFWAHNDYGEVGLVSLASPRIYIPAGRVPRKGGRPA